MVVPPFVGAEVVKASGLGNPRGFIDVKDTYQTLAYPNVYAAGIAAAVNAPWQTANAVGVPKTGFPAETMAHVAAENIASQIRGEEPTKEENFGDIPAVCIMDAGNNGVVILADKMPPPRCRSTVRVVSPGGQPRPWVLPPQGPDDSAMDTEPPVVSLVFRWWVGPQRETPVRGPPRCCWSEAHFLERTTGFEPATPTLAIAWRLSHASPPVSAVALSCTSLAPLSHPSQQIAGVDSISLVISLVFTGRAAGAGGRLRRR
jgi:hypothetical protein